MVLVTDINFSQLGNVLSITPRTTTELHSFVIAIATTEIKRNKTLKGSTQNRKWNKNGYLFVLLAEQEQLEQIVAEGDIDLVFVEDTAQPVEVGIGLVVALDIALVAVGDTVLAVALDIVQVAAVEDKNQAVIQEEHSWLVDQ